MQGGDHGDSGDRIGFAGGKTGAFQVGSRCNRDYPVTSDGQQAAIGRESFRFRGAEANGKD